MKLVHIPGYRFSPWNTFKSSDPFKYFIQTINVVSPWRDRLLTARKTQVNKVEKSCRIQTLDFFPWVLHSFKRLSASPGMVKKIRKHVSWWIFGGIWHSSMRRNGMHLCPQWFYYSKLWTTQYGTFSKTLS